MLGVGDFFFTHESVGSKLASPLRSEELAPAGGWDSPCGRSPKSRAEPEPKPGPNAGAKSESGTFYWGCFRWVKERIA